ncbi:hypothetical protein ACFQ36_02435 [Arthrobacter sp. GCM10027362]|uniref:hypothetical protein n=1 Tax=Arthrobacter sp. GCM10027362 TaxID=3273379 RepID=UPI003638EE11
MKIVQTVTTFYMSATPRPGTEDAFEECIRRLAAKGTAEGARFSIIELTRTSAALRGEMPAAECPDCPEELATYLEDRLDCMEDIHLDLDVHII